MAAQWQWQSDTKPCDVADPEKVSWTSYAPEENFLIEQAYCSSSSEPIVIYDYYVIDIQKQIQYVQNAPTHQRPIRRLSNVQNMNDEHIRQNRFIFSGDHDHFFQPFETDIKFGSLMIQEWHKHFIECHQGDVNVSEKDIVDAAIKGIEEEGSKNIEFSGETKIICNELRKVRNCENKVNRKECAVKLYTRPGFLYKLVNRALRERDRRIYRDTLGPYCYLLYSYLCLRSPFGIDFYRGTVYRGARLHPGMIGRFQKEMKQGDKFLTWLGFTSTTKSSAVANEFTGNTLFEILLTDTDHFTCQGVDISKLSHFPNEEEVLLPSGFQFQIVDVKPLEPTKNKPYPCFHIQILPRQCDSVVK
ncbi:unnamed protein product [Rotaria sp. Silwood1]|nr:unnamed protein product [Rotaria sp. Silwood1]CAF1498429.1 unnamed protein product [Rotaria sp. Silwood1]CAF3651755.1 unnamed protein product [Rotaria sp. Silwood1]CAF3695964.1 unnamed protein product [Rotaria sp. Silwood1]CAF4728378.1 unnamed protein product [Rotaria sp. Silwood1]